MTTSIIFHLNETKFQFPCSYKLLKRIPSQYEKLLDQLISHHMYYIQSPVKNEIFQLFLDFWANETTPELNEDNIWEFYLLSNEFGIMSDYISSPQFEHLFNISFLIHSEQEQQNNNNNNIQLSQNYDKSNIEKKIATHLEEYMVSSPQELFKIPLNSLFNIFNHSENNLQDHELAYKQILKAAENQNEDLLLLLNFLDGSRINSPEIRSEAFMQRYEHFGFSPKNIIPDDVLKNQNEQNQQLKKNVDELIEENRELAKLNDQLSKENEELKSFNEKLEEENQRLKNDKNSYFENEQQLKNENQSLMKLIHVPTSFQLKEIKILKAIGSGSFGKVFLIENTLAKKKYISKISHKSFDVIEKSLRSLSKIQNAAILPIINIDKVKIGDTSHLSITTKYMPSRLIDQDFSHFGSTQKYIIILGIALGMQYLHFSRIVHGNLKPTNVFLDENYYPLISDFGLSVFNSKSIYVAPDILNCLDFKSDVYSYGKILFLIVTGYELMDEIGLFLIENDEIKKILRKCLFTYPSNRPFFSEIIEELTNDDIISSFGVNDIEQVVKYLKFFVSTQGIAEKVYQKIMKNHPELLTPKSQPKESSSLSIDADYRVEVVLAGSTFAGKTTLFSTYLHGKEYSSNGSINTGDMIVQADDEKIDLKIIDIPSSDECKCSLYKILTGAHAIIFTISVNMQDELGELQHIIDDIFHSCDHKDKLLCLAATHTDLEWVISKQELESLAEENNLLLFITSINDYNSIDHMFTSIAKEVVKNYYYASVVQIAEGKKLGTKGNDNDKCLIQ